MNENQEKKSTDSYIERKLRRRASFTSEKYPIVWAAIERKGKTKFIGICGKTWKPCFFTTEFLHAGVVKDLDTDIDFCQDEDHCLNIQCNLNRTTPESLAQIKQLGPKYAKELQENWKYYKENFSNNYNKLAEICKKEFEETGNAHILWIKSEPMSKQGSENHE